MDASDLTDVTELTEWYGLDAGAASVLAAAAESPVVLVNHFALRPVAEYAAGDAEADDVACSGVDAMMRYAEVSGPALAAVGGTFLHQGLHVGPLWGEGAWDLVIVASYPNADAVAGLLRDPAYRAGFRHRRAAVARQHVSASLPFG